MAMIFPGMDPYLENPAVFPGIHTRMIVYMADLMVPLLRPRYIASTGERVYVEGPEPRPITPTYGSGSRFAGTVDSPRESL